MTLFLMGWQVILFAQFDYQIGLRKVVFVPFSLKLEGDSDFVSEVDGGSLQRFSDSSVWTFWPHEVSSQWGFNYIKAEYRRGRPDVVMRIQREEPYAWQRIAPDTSEWFVPNSEFHELQWLKFVLFSFDQSPGILAPALPYDCEKVQRAEDNLKEKLKVFNLPTEVFSMDSTMQHAVVVRLLGDLHEWRITYVNYPTCMTLLERHLTGLAETFAQKGMYFELLSVSASPRRATPIYYTPNCGIYRAIVCDYHAAQASELDFCDDWAGLFNEAAQTVLQEKD